MTDSDLPTLGFLGVGAMGGRMARNLLAAGYPVVAYDTDPGRLAACVADGAVAAESADQAVRRGEVVLASLPSSEAFVRAAEEVLLPAARPGQAVIELGTTVPLEVRRLAAAFCARGAALLDVPVSGWITGAESGTLILFVGGDPDVFARCRPILEVIGDPARTTYCGESGAGQVAKGVNQLLSGLVNAALLETVAFGQLAGLDLATIGQAVGDDGDGPRGQLRKLVERLLAGEGEAVGVKFRELPYYLEEARAQGFALPLTETLHAFCDRGERVVIDDNRPAPSFWRELTRDQSRM